MKTTYQIPILLTFVLMILSKNIEAQSGDVLTITHNCETNCLNLEINGGYPNYDVEWQVFNNTANNYTTVQGWPKTGLTGNNGMEDLCSPTGIKYKVIVHDALCGEAEADFEIEPCKCKPEIILEDIHNVSNCADKEPDEQNSQTYDECDGSLSISVVSNSTTSILWSNGSISNELSDLCIGTYSVTVTNTTGCTASKSFDICCCVKNSGNTNGGFPLCPGTGPSNVEADLTSPTSATAANGSILLTVSNSGGPSNNYYSWSGPNGFKSNSKDISGLRVGTYCVTITNGCSDPITKCYTLKDCSNVVLNISGVVLNTCGTTANGTINVAASGGESPYKFKWSNGKLGPSINSLLSGSYCVSVTDNGGCSGTACFIVTGATSLVPVKTTSPCQQKDYCNGNLVTTTNQPYSVSWDCNIEYFYCPITQQTIVLNYGSYTSAFLSGCDLWGVCWSGEFQFIEGGTLEYGPFLIEEKNCANHVACVDYACFLPSFGYILPENYTSYCSSSSNFYDPHCQGTECIQEFYCDGIYSGSECVTDKNVICGLGKENNSRKEKITNDSIIEIIHAFKLDSFSKICSKFGSVSKIEEGCVKLNFYSKEDKNINFLFYDEDKSEVKTYSAKKGKNEVYNCDLEKFKDSTLKIKMICNDCEGICDEEIKIINPKILNRAIVKNENKGINEVNIFPNPSSGKFELTMNGNSKISYLVYNAIGEIILNGKSDFENIKNQKLIIDLSDKNNGMYFLKINDNSEIKKLINSN